MLLTQGQTNSTGVQAAAQEQTHTYSGVISDHTVWRSMGKCGLFNNESGTLGYPYGEKSQRDFYIPLPLKIKSKQF